MKNEQYYIDEITARGYSFDPTTNIFSGNNAKFTLELVMDLDKYHNLSAIDEIESIVKQLAVEET